MEFSERCLLCLKHSAVWLRPLILYVGPGLLHWLQTSLNSMHETEFQTVLQWMFCLFVCREAVYETNERVYSEGVGSSQLLTTTMTKLVCVYVCWY